MRERALAASKAELKATKEEHAASQSQPNGADAQEIQMKFTQAERQWRVQENALIDEISRLRHEVTLNSSRGVTAEAEQQLVDRVEQQLKSTHNELHLVGCSAALKILPP